MADNAAFGGAVIFSVVLTDGRIAVVAGFGGDGFFLPLLVEELRLPMLLSCEQLNYPSRAGENKLSLKETHTTMMRLKIFKKQKRKQQQPKNVPKKGASVLLSLSPSRLNVPISASPSFLGSGRGAAHSEFNLEDEETTALYETIAVNAFANGFSDQSSGLSTPSGAYEHERAGSAQAHVKA